MKKLIAAAILILFLTGCGGDNPSGSSPVTITVTNSQSYHDLYIWSEDYYLITRVYPLQTVELLLDIGDCLHYQYCVSTVISQSPVLDCSAFQTECYSADTTVIK